MEGHLQRRPPSLLVKVLAIVLLLLMVLFLGISIATPFLRPSLEDQASAECRESYARARSKSDSELVDRHFPVNGALRGPSRTSGPLACSDLRLTSPQGSGSPLRSAPVTGTTPR